METKQNDKECCPMFDPEPWDDTVFDWDHKLFIRDKVCTLFYMPMNFGKVITRMVNKLELCGATTPGFLCLSDHTSKWNMDLYLAVDKEVPGADNCTLSGKYYCKVYEGNFNKTGEWCKDYESVAKGKGYEIKKMYMWYTTCPKCAKKYGKNYVVIVGQIA
ncbi:MAG: hypothetical protein PHI48_09825 [Bacteroidales bacterium]|nr:hypothetical protein [Bacteroidales bacterium]MDD4822839.1 hypothetical protein [Bacteroidales bacterium]